MGRRGGSGGRSGGGSFGGNRSSGGRSGGSFGGSPGRGSFGGRKSSGGFFGSGQNSGGFFGGGVGRQIPGPFGGGGFSRNSGSGVPGCGCSTVLIALVIIVILILVLSASSSMFGDYGSSGDITKSTVQREALPAGSVNETNYYTDELGWITDQTQLVSGLKYFYQKTGVQPYLYITDTVNGSHSPSSTELDDFANDLYDQLFTDEAHLLFVFLEYNNAYMDRYVCGTQAKTVIDSEAADILLDYVDRYYYDNSLTDEVFFSKAFSEAADRIMAVTRSPWIMVLTIFGLVVLVAILFIWWRHVQKQKNLEAQQREQIFNTPLEKFGDTEVEDLAKKYEDPKR